MSKDDASKWNAVVDIVAVLTEQSDYQTAREYWNKLKERLKKEGSESVTNCHQLRMPAADGKNYLTDVANPETLLRLVQSIPSPKAESIMASSIYTFCGSLREHDRSRDILSWVESNVMGQKK